MGRPAASAFCLSRTMALLCLLLASAAAFGAEQRLEGLWKTIDDHSGLVRAIVRIQEVGGEYQGRLEKLFLQAGEEPNPRCEQCAGERHNKPVEGLLIVERMRLEGDDYSGGEILDPESSAIYCCRMQLADDGRKLMVRGYLGISILGRTQTWLRAEP